MTTLLPSARPRMRAGWLTGFGLAWLGVSLAQLTVIQLLLPQQVAAHAGRGWLASVAAFGVVSALAGIAALVVLPVAGALSDRTRSRFGRRRPWILGGGIAFGLGLVLLGLQGDLVGVTLCWSLALGGFAATTAGLTAMIADRVPVGQRAFVSAFVSAPQALGIVVGLAIIEALNPPVPVAYALLAALLIALLLPFVLRAADPLPAAGPAPIRPGALAASLVDALRRDADFAWTFAGRVLVNLGNALGTTLLLYFLAYGLHDAGAAGDLVLLSLVYVVLLTAATIIAGRLSDRTGRRRIFVAVAAALQGTAALLLAVAPSFPVALVSAGLLGAGYGVFLSVDQALATQVLPNAAASGRDLGLMNTAVAVPQAAGPLLGAGIVVATGGFAALFAVAGLLSIAGAAAVARVRSVP